MIQTITLLTRNNNYSERIKTKTIFCVYENGTAECPDANIEDLCQCHTQHPSPEHRQNTKGLVVSGDMNILVGCGRAESDVKPITDN